MAAIPQLATDDDVLSVRQNLITNGYRIVPCKGKIPSGFKGWQDLHATAENAVDWESSFPENRNTGILTGDVVAIDVDILRPDLAAAVIAMVRELPSGEVAPMRVGKAPKAMFLFRTGEPRDKSVTDWFKIDGVDQRIEVMGKGQQVIVDGIHPDTGQPYSWDRQIAASHDLPLLDWSSLERMLADVSALLARHAEQRKPAPKPRVANNDNVADNYFRRVNQAALDNLAAWVPSLELPKTKRHGEGYRAVCVWRGVKNANLSFHPGGITDWGSGETHTAIDVAFHAGKGDGAASAAEWLCTRLGKAKDDLGWIDKGAPIVPNAEAIAAIVAKKSKSVDIRNPFTPDAIGGLGGMVAEWILSTSRRKSPELAAMAAMAFLSAFYGRRVATPTGCGVNVYLAGIAGPGFGKEAPLARLVNLLQASGLAYLIGPGEVTSAGAIEKVLRKKPVMVMPWDEVGDVLESMNTGSAGTGNWTATIRKAMLELYSKSTGVWFGKERVDDEKNSDPIHCPTMSVVGTSTPIRFYGGLSEGNLKDGFVARWIFIAPKDRPVRANPQDNGLHLPGALSSAVEKAQESFKWPTTLSGGPGAWRTAAAIPSLLEVPWADTKAEHAWLAIEDWQEEEIIRDESRDGIIGRFAENAIRLATLRALSRNPAEAAVTVEDVAWSRAMMDASIAAIESGIDKHMMSSKFEGLCKAIVSALMNAKDRQLYRAELLRRRGVRGADSRTLDDALKRLQETGEVERSDGKTYRLSSSA